MKLAFLILAHKNPEQLQLLTDHLLKNDCLVFVHVDKKSGALFSEFLSRNSQRKNLHCYSRYKVYWGSYSQIEATFFLLKQAAEYPADYFCLISGQDLLIKPVEYLRTFLKQHEGRSFVEYYPLPATDKMEGNGGLDRAELFWFTDFPKSVAFVFNRLNVLIHLLQKALGLKRRWNIELYAGPNWFVLHRSAVEAVLMKVAALPWLLSKFRHTRLADEIVMQTLLIHSGCAPGLVNDSLRYVDWHSGPEYPRTLRVSDLEKLQGTGAFFARKFDDTTDREIISLIYSRIDA